MISIEVNCLVMEPRRNFTSVVFGMFHSRLARPEPFLKMTLSWSETRTVPVNEQQSAYCDMSLSIFAALSGVSAAEADEICQRRVKRRTRRMNFFIAALTLRDGLTSQGMRDCIPKTRQCIEQSLKGTRALSIFSFLPLTQFWNAARNWARV